MKKLKNEGIMIQKGIMIKCALISPLPAMENPVL